MWAETALRGVAEGHVAVVHRINCRVDATRPVTQGSGADEAAEVVNAAGCCSGRQGSNTSQHAAMGC